MPTPPTPFQLHLKSLNACPDARQWAGPRTAKQAWDECERADWLLWWAARDGASKQQIVAVACEIARTVLHLSKTPKALMAIEAAEKWVANPTEENRTLCRVTDAAYAADAAAAAAYAADDAAAAYAADAAYAYAAAYTAAYIAAAAAAYAADAAAYAADAADAADDAAAAYAVAAAARSHANYCMLIRAKLPRPWTEPAP
jgi:hypothetical protein